MTLAAFAAQLLNGLASASTLFLVAAGLSLIFGVTRVVNFAHGSFFMLGLYSAYSIAGWTQPSGVGFWAAVLATPVAIAALGAAVEILLLRRLYRAPELFQLLATFGLVLVLKDAALYLWGPQDLIGPRAPGLAGAVMLFDRAIPQYELFLIAVGPLVLAALWAILRRTRFGLLVRAATEDRDMVAALGVNQAWLFTAVFALGCGLAGLAGALQLPREPATLSLDLAIIADAFVIVVVGGLGSIPGAFLAALLIGIVKSLCTALGDQQIFGLTLPLSQATLAIEFIVMAIVLVVRPYGLLGRARDGDALTLSEPMLTPFSRLGSYAVMVGAIALLALPIFADRYALVLTGDILAFALFAVSLHFLMGPAGMASFGHAAFFGAGAYGAALLVLRADWPMELALLAAPLIAGALALLFGWFCVRLSGVYSAMLTLAFAQILWSIAFQWDWLTGGSNGLTGVWPAPWLASTHAYYLLTLLLAGLAVLALWHIALSPFGYALRAARDSARRAAAIGIPMVRLRWLGFGLAGAFAGLAGALYAFSKGSISPELLAIPRSVDGLAMVLLGGVQTLTGPVLGAAALTVLQDELARATEYWRAAIGAIIVALAVLFPAGIGGGMKQLLRWARRRAA